MSACLARHVRQRWIAFSQRETCPWRFFRTPPSQQQQLFSPRAAVRLTLSPEIIGVWSLKPDEGMRYAIPHYDISLHICSFPLQAKIDFAIEQPSWVAIFRCAGLRIRMLHFMRVWSSNLTLSTAVSTHEQLMGIKASQQEVPEQSGSHDDDAHTRARIICLYTCSLYRLVQYC